MTNDEATTLGRGDRVAIKQLPGRVGLLVEIRNDGREFDVFVEGVGLVDDARPSDLTLVARHEEMEEWKASTRSTNLIVLESMWTGRAGARAPRWFPISNDNHSGARLHRILGVDPNEGNVWVTNACQIQQATAKHHGTPDPNALAKNILSFPAEIAWLIVGGKVAGETFHSALAQGGEALVKKLRWARILHMPHPAARFWGRRMEEAVAAFLREPGQPRQTSGTTWAAATSTSSSRRRSRRRSRFGS